MSTIVRHWAAAVMALGLAWAVQSQASPADNKLTAINAMTDLFSKQDPSGVDRYFTSPYHQHNTMIPDGLDALRGLAHTATTWPGVHTNIVRAVADGDLVVLHSAYWNLGNGQETAVAFDLFQFNQAGKITAHWDALEGFPGKSAAARAQYEGSTTITDLDKTEANRKIVGQYIKTVLIGGKAEQKSQFLDAREFLDHGLTDTSMAELSKRNPFANTKWSLSQLRYVKAHRVLAEGNFVLVQGEGRLKKNDQIVEVYDLFRLKGGKIVEHWDVHQALAPPAKWANPNGPF